MKLKTIQKMLALLVAAVMLLSLAACGSNPSQVIQTSQTVSGSSTQAQTTATVEKQKEPITIRLLINQTGTSWNNYIDSDVQKEIKKQTGVTVEYVEADPDKYNVLLASGDLPDMIRTDTTKFNQLIEGGLVIPLDDLLKTNGPDILNNIPDTLELSKKFWSDGQNKVYFIPPQIQTVPSPYFYDTGGMGSIIRWDYYKELGAPEIKDEDDLLKVISDIVKKHPKTDDGKTVYGISMWNDWGLWQYIYPAFFLCGQRDLGQLMLERYTDNALSCMLTDMNGAYWQAITLYYKANKQGLLDPDAFTMKFADYTNKATSGQYVLVTAQWAAGSFNTDNAKNQKGFMGLPLDWGYQFDGGTSPIGWSDKTYAITKSAKQPDRIMDLMNFLWSYNGCRILYSGIKGVNWDIVNGVPKLTDNTIQLKNAAGDAWDKTGIQMDGNFTGLNGNEINPADNSPLDLFQTPEIFATLNNPLQKDFSDYYGVKYPGEIFMKKAKEGKSQNLDNYNPLIASVIPSLPDDIKRIEAKLVDIAIKDASKCILSKSDSEFETNKNNALNDFKAAGVDQYTEWYTKAYTDAKAALEAK